MSRVLDNGRGVTFDEEIGAHTVQSGGQPATINSKEEDVKGVMLGDSFVP